MANEFIWTHEFGPARVAVINEASGSWPMERAIEGVSEDLWRAEIPTIDENFMAIDFNLMHVALPGASILIDTGFGEYDPTDTRNPLVSVRNMRMTGTAERALAALGVKPEEITHVLITHMHGDHILGATRTTTAGKRVPTYPNARYYITEAEWQEAPAVHQNAEAINAQKAALQEADVVELTAGDREIIPGVFFLWAPGESAGHAIVRIQAGDEVVYNLGDLFHYPAEFRHLDWRPRYRDVATLVASRRKYLPRFLAEDAWLIPAHHRFPAVGKVVSEGTDYRWIGKAP